METAPQSDPYDWLLASYVWRFNSARQLGQVTPAPATLQAVRDIVEGLLTCYRQVRVRGYPSSEFREIAYRVVNNLRRIEHQLGDKLAGAANVLDGLVTEYDIVDPSLQGLAEVVDWNARDVTASGLDSGTNSTNHRLTVIVQRQLEEIYESATEGRFLQESFIAIPDLMCWSCGDELDLKKRPVVVGPAGSKRGELSFRFTQNRWSSGPICYEHVYKYEMTWSATAYRFDFDLLPRRGHSAFSLDRGFLSGEKRIGHPGETVISVQREAWLQGDQKSLNVMMPVILRMQMFDAVCVFLKDMRGME